MRGNVEVRRIVAVLGVVAASLMAQADVISFSGQVSDNDQPADVFDAEVSFGFDSGTNILTMQITNQTSSPTAYTLSRLYFNVSNDVSSIAIQNDGALNNTSLTTNASAGPFGSFDFLFDLGSGNSGLAAGSTVTVTFLVTGTNLDTGDFFFGFSDAPSGYEDSLAAVKWAQGPGDDSVWATNATANVVPEPATMSLLAIGLAGLVLRKKPGRS